MRSIFLVAMLGGCLFFSCRKNDNIVSDQIIDNSAKYLSAGKVLLSKNKHIYFYDLKIFDNSCMFFDNQTDTAIWIFEKESFSTPVVTIKRSFDQDGVRKPYATKEVGESIHNADKILMIDDNIYCKQLKWDTLNKIVTISRLPFNQSNRIYSTDFNLTTKNVLYAIPIHRRNKNPFYFFKPDSGYHWVNPAKKMQMVLPDDVFSYTSTICLNEKQNSIVAAYRFTNYISFYDLDGKLRHTIQFGKESIIPTLGSEKEGINIEKATKCFIHIYGTPQYVYCLYDGSNDFTNSSKILVFKWDGKHIATWQADRNLRAIAIDQENKYILAIASNKNGQDIIRYDL